MRQSSCGRVNGLAKSGFQSSHGVPDYRDGEVLFATKAMTSHYRENGILLAARRLTWALTGFNQCQDWGYIAQMRNAAIQQNADWCQFLAN